MASGSKKSEGGSRGATGRASEAAQSIGSARACDQVSLEKLAEIGNDHVGTRAAEGSGTTVAVHSHDEGEPRGARCGDSSRSCPERGGCPRLDSELPAGGEEDFGCGPRAQRLEADRFAVDVAVDQSRESCALEDAVGVRV